MSTYTEDHLVEQPAIQLMQHELGWEVVNCYDEWNGGVSNQGRDGKREVVLVSRLRPSLQRLNPDLSVEAIEGAVEEICRDRTALSLSEANREIDKLLKQGVKVSFPDQELGSMNIRKTNRILTDIRISRKREMRHFRESLTFFHPMRLFHQSVK